MQSRVAELELALREAHGEKVRLDVTGSPDRRGETISKEVVNDSQAVSRDNKDQPSTQQEFQRSRDKDEEMRI